VHLTNNSVLFVDSFNKKHIPALKQRYFHIIQTTSPLQRKGVSVVGDYIQEMKRQIIELS